MADPRRRLIVVSNRGPVVHGRDADGGRVARRGGGGLVTALDGLAEHHDVTWIASAISDEDRAVAREAGVAGVGEVSRSGSTYHLRLLAHEPEAYRRFYDVVANPTLWFTQHRLWNGAQPPPEPALRDAWETGYAVVNAAFAEAVSDELIASPDATVFFHDYHVYLAPRLVRARHPAARLAHFVHVPWVEAADWRVLPGDLVEAVHDGLLANDLVGFHTDRWRDAFVSAARDVLGATTRGAALHHAGRWTETAARPISVDPDEFTALAASEAVRSRRQAIASGRPEQLVVRVDRTDPSKNVVRGIEAFCLLLARHPEHRGRTRLLALLDPSRQEIDEYAAYTAAIERVTATANAEAGETVVDLRIDDDFPLSVAAYLEYDVLFVNPLSDGLNLVAKEGPLVNERDGVLVLSEHAGAAEELGRWAILVDPLDVEGQAEALHAALVLDRADRRRRSAAIREHVVAHPVSDWALGVLGDLDRARS